MPWDDLRKILHGGQRMAVMVGRMLLLLLYILLYINMID